MPGLGPGQERNPLPLGQLCLPGLRWILRRFQLRDDEDTRFLLREYILSGWNVAREFESFLDMVNPRVVVVFNGQFFPEAVARHLALRRGLKVVTHEAGSFEECYHASEINEEPEVELAK